MKFKPSLKFAKASILAAMTIGLSIASTITPSLATQPKPLTEQQGKDFIAQNSRELSSSVVLEARIAPPVKPNMTLTFINRGAYIAKYNIQYNINGKNQTFESGKIPVGKRFTFVIPGNVEAISTEGVFFNGIFLQQVGSIFFNPRFENRHSNVCVTTYGTTFKPSHDSSCK